jgi:hypothetical protein
MFVKQIFPSNLSNFHLQVPLIPNIYFVQFVTHIDIRFSYLVIKTNKTCFKIFIYLIWNEHN